MTSGCEALRSAVGGCRLVLLAATDLEAEPLRASLVGAERHEVGGKTAYVGELPAAGGQRSRVVLGVSGCDKVNAAILLTGLLQAMAPMPELVLQVGIAGAFPAVEDGAAARVGDLVIATREAYSDVGSTSPDGWIPAVDLGIPIAEVDGVESGGVFPLDAGLVEWAARALVAAGVAAAEVAAEAAAVAPGASASEGGPAVPAVLAGPCVTASTVTGTDEEARSLAVRWGALAESMEGAAAAHVCALHRVPFLEVRGISNLVGDRDRSSWQVPQAVETVGRATAVLVEAFTEKTGA